MLSLETWTHGLPASLVYLCEEKNILLILSSDAHILQLVQNSQFEVPHYSIALLQKNQPSYAGSHA